MKIHIYILVIAIMLVSCKTTKQVSKFDSRIVEKVQTEQKIEMTAAETEKLESKTDEKVIESDSTVTEETELHFSAPDSLGNQYVEKAITRKTTSGKKREGNKSTETDQSKGKTNNRVDTKSENKQSDSNIQTEIKTSEKAKVQYYTYIISIILICVIIYVVYKLKLHIIFKRIFSKFIQ